MPFFSAAIGSVSGVAFLSHLFTTDNSSHSHHSSFSALANPPLNFPNFCRNSSIKRPTFYTAKVSVSGGSVQTEGVDVEQAAAATAGDDEDSSASPDRRSADWKAARAYNARGLIYEGRIEGFNGGGLLVRFYSLVGFLPFPQLSPSHSCKEPHRTIQEIAQALTGSIISMKVIQADEENRKLIFSEREAAWSKFSQQINVGDIFEARVGSVEDYGAFVHLRFPDGCYHLTGLVHVSEVSWDLVQDVRDILNEGDEVRVKVIKIDREKSRITLSIKQLEEDPLLETLDKVIPQDGSVGPDSLSTSHNYNIEPLPGLEAIFEELLREDGIIDVRITRQGFEKRVVSQDLQLWLSNAPVVGKQFTLLARAGRQVQEIQLTTSLDQEGIKKALQRVLERIP
uniref:S1 motif domain-containing protein n=1 Tax=Davidia involucrata TaxID=16924 RepID=A0A5B7BLB0_DAVIN